MCKLNKAQIVPSPLSSSSTNINAKEGEEKNTTRINDQKEKKKTHLSQLLLRRKVHILEVI
jgi:hypothetical protein